MLSNKFFRSPRRTGGRAQRGVYTPDGKAGLGAKYVNCPTLTLDPVNGAKVLVDARDGKTATLTLSARFQHDIGKAMIAYLPGRNYGPMDEQVLLATHADAMSLIEENGGLGMLGICSALGRKPCTSRHRGRHARLRRGLFRAAGCRVVPARRLADAGQAADQRSRLG